MAFLRPNPGAEPALAAARDAVAELVDEPMGVGKKIGLAIVPPPRFLLVTDEAGLATTLRGAARQLGATFDQVADIGAAIAWLLAAHGSYTHIFYSDDLRVDEIETLAGLAADISDNEALVLRLAEPYGSRASAALLQPADSESLARTIAELASPVSLAAPLQAAQIAALVHGGGLRVRFQPILHATDLKPAGIEMLARLSLAGSALLQPRDFLHEMGGVQERMLMTVAASRLAIAQRAGLLPDDLSIMVNLSLEAMMHPASIERSRDLCSIAGLPPQRIVIEALEAPDPPDYHRLGAAMEAWHKAGFKIAMDDAGPAMPHWPDMLALPFDIVKLDAALIAPAAVQTLAVRITEAAHRRSMHVIAEGVEDEAGLGRARATGVDAVQGYYFARPLPAPALLPWMERWRGVRGQAE